jgi:hypothetical protein
MATFTEFLFSNFLIWVCCLTGTYFGELKGCALGGIIIVSMIVYLNPHNKTQKIDQVNNN